jgi:hypothetical protein
MRRAEHQIGLHVIRKGEGVWFLQPEPLARCNKRDTQRQTSQDVACHREAGGDIVSQHSIRDAAPSAEENYEDEGGVDLAGRKMRVLPRREYYGDVGSLEDEWQRLVWTYIVLGAS